MRRVFLSGVWLVPMLVWACGDNNAANPFGYGGAGGAGGTGTGGSSALPCDVELVVREKCQLCHAAQPLYGAPMPLVNAKDFAAPGQSDPSKTMAQLVSERIHDPDKPMPPRPTGPLDAAALETLDAWLIEGAPGGKTPCSTMSGGGGSSGGGTVACVPDVKLRAATAYKMPKLKADQYVCYGADIAVAEKRHIIGVVPAIDNEVIVHHMLLYETDTARSPTPSVCGPAGPTNGRLVSVWAPGAQALELPPQAGMPLDGTKHYVIQLHYSNLMKLSGQTDLSGFDICTTTNLRANDADILAFGTLNINIPAHGSSDRTCDLIIPPELPKINVFAAGPHMHTYGKFISGEVLHSSGDPYTLATRNPWSFDSQYWDAVSTTVSPGDTVRVRCAWNNPTATPVLFGEKTTDEMCYVFAAYWPRITLPQWNWQATAVFANCTDTP